jgi:hypothetical protein
MKAARCFLFLIVLFTAISLYPVLGQEVPATEMTLGMAVVYNNQSIPVNVSLNVSEVFSSSSWPENVLPLYPGSVNMCEYADNKAECYEAYSNFLRQFSLYGWKPNYVIAPGSVEEIDQWYQQYFSNAWVAYGDSGNKEYTGRYYMQCDAQKEVIFAGYWVIDIDDPEAPNLVLWIARDKDLGENATGFRSMCGLGSELLGSVQENSTCEPITPMSLLELHEETRRDIQSRYGITVCDGTQCHLGFGPFTLAELSAIDETIGSLPLCTRSKLGNLEVCGVRSPDDICAKNDGLYGHQDSTGYSNRVTICDSRWDFKSERLVKFRFLGEGKELNKEVLLHELGHILHGSIYYADLFLIRWAHATGYDKCVPILGCEVRPDDFPTEYAQTDMGEDIAESFRLYVTQPAYLKQVSLRRYNFLKDNVFCGNEY